MEGLERLEAPEGEGAKSELRSEIVEAQKARTELLKWKLVLTAALGATGLGLGTAEARVSPTTPNLSLVLCCIPLLCAYVDLICAHLSLRILVIGTFLRNRSTGEAAEYEQFAEKARNVQAYSLEQWASFGSSYLLSLFVGGIGVERVSQTVTDAGWWAVAVQSWPYLVAALIGLVGTFAVWRASASRSEAIKLLGKSGPPSAESRDR